ncbi:MAG: hypothetical protein ACRBFS_19505 [Aureispira sp.]
MIAEFSFYINDIKVNPVNSGELSITKNLKFDKGGRYFETELSGDIKLGAVDYRKLNLVNHFEGMPLRVVEVFNGISTTVCEGVVMRSSGKEHPHKEQISLKVKSRNAVGVFLANADQTLNLMRVAPAVDYEYRFINNIEYLVVKDANFAIGVISNSKTPKPYWGHPIEFASGGSVGAFFLVYAREIKTIYNQAGESRAPEGEGWSRLQLNRDNRNSSSWFRVPPMFDPVPDGVAFFYSTIDLVNQPPTLPPSPNEESWRLIGEHTEGNAVGRVYVDDNLVQGNGVKVNNGRQLIDVLRYGVRKASEDLTFISEFLTKDTNPVTGLANETKGMVLHSSEDVKSPLTDPSNFSRRHDFSILNVLESLCNRFNLYWRVDEMSWQVALEHVSAPRDGAIIDLNAFFSEHPSITYEEEELPKYEEFKAVSDNIDFSGTSIENYSNAAANTSPIDISGIATDVYEILNNPDDYSDEILVLTQPQSLDFNGLLAENGAITGDFTPNAALSQSNLNAKYAPFWRRVPFVGYNFNDHEATIRPFRLIPTVYKRDTPLSGLIGITHARLRFFPEAGEIQSIKFNLGSQVAEIEIKF